MSIFSKNDQNGQFSIKLYEKVRVVTCNFYSFNDKFLNLDTCAKSQSYVNAGLITSKCP